MQNEIKYFSMFTGVGGFELGFEGYRRNKPHREDSRRQGSEFDTSLQENKQCSTYTCVGFSEIDKYANQVLRYRFKIYGKGIKNYGDATKINPRELPEFDMLCGGFPCQAFSIAGKRKGFSDTRGTLFFDVARIIKVKRPKIIFLENVKGLLNHEKGKTFRVIIQTLSELGYDVQWMVLNSKFFGVPQNRERVFIIGSIRGASRPKILPLGKCEGETKELVYAQKSDREIARVYDTKGIAPTLHLKTGGWQEPKIVASRGRNPMNPSDRTTGSPTEQRLEINSEGISNTLSSVQKDNMVIAGCIDANYWKGNSPSHREQKRTRTEVIDGTQIRRLTPTECERLQGFPDDWTRWGTDEKGITVELSDTQRYKLMGNAVTVNVIEAIASKLRSSF